MLDPKIIAQHYIIAALWADAPEGTRPRAPRETEEKALQLARDFARAIGPKCQEYLENNTEYFKHPDCGGRAEAAIGHDLWLTSQGHGVGFWERDALREDVREFLTGCAQRKEFTLYPEFYRGWMYLR